MKRWQYKGQGSMEVRRHSHGAGKLATTTCIATDAGFRVASVIIEGERELVVVDTQWTLANAHRVLAEILELDKPLKAIFITHAHPDHYFGTQVFTEAFPDTPVFALSDDIPIIALQFLPKLEHWQEEIGNYNMANRDISFLEYYDGALDLDGFEVRAVSHCWGDLKWNSKVVIPSISTIICSDIVFSDAHPFTCEVPPVAGWDLWIDELEAIRAAGYQVIIPGHAAFGREFNESGLDYTKSYLEATKRNFLLCAKLDDAEARVSQFLMNMELEFFDSELRKSNEMNAAVLLGSREWNDQWNNNWDEAL
jgi:glyoxylase-like metal-dependent hydrolase (beta-lactamase superfamily II)